MEMNQLSLLEELLLAQSSTTTPGYPWFHTGLSAQNVTIFDEHTTNIGLMNSSTTISDQSSITLPFGNGFFSNADLEGGSGSGFMEDQYVVPPFLPIIQDDRFAGMEEGLVQMCSNNSPRFANNNDDLGCKVEGELEGMSECTNNKSTNSRMKKVGAQPSKNLMAERRRRKRLNDRLSMLRSIVPKISKMDRTAIVGDTIDYMKELLSKIEKLRENKHIDTGNTSSCFFDDTILPANHSLLRNNPKFEVQRREEDTRIELCCNAKPGMLLSTLGTLETLGLDVQQCVISCFNDFSLQASCSEAVEHHGIITPEDIKQALFRNAGYGGRCL